MRTLAEIKMVIAQNRKEKRETYHGLDSSEIGRHSRSIMFGDGDEAFPSTDEWARIVD